MALAGIMTAAGAVLMWPGQPSGRLVKVYGDLAAAGRVAIIVPGADTTVETFEAGTKRPGGAARALLAEAARLAPGERLAVVAWLGYDAPPTLSLGAIIDDAAVEGAAELRRTVSDLRTRTTAPISLLCHSYGSVLCARAVPGLPVTDLAVFGSPGLGAPSAAALHTTPPAEAPGTDALPRPATRHATAGAALPSAHETSAATPSPLRVWAGLGENDWIRFVPKTKIGPLGFGTDPMSPGYGAHIFEVGRGGHSDYFRSGTPSLRNLALIALGHPERVTS
ncbi:alpha/beta hydrolase [Nonomuraea sp. NPDC049480]|uniref:alpha/beta hydrolase n=1 Tax=Nonomuraea sp. NPDC049480 TaxID=3364353 RepID=UPI0037A61D8B